MKGLKKQRRIQVLGLAGVCLLGCSGACLWFMPGWCLPVLSVTQRGFGRTASGG